MILVNRILIDEGLNSDDEIIVEINKDGNYLLNNLSKKYILNIRNSNVNILSETTNCSNLDIVINIYNSFVVYNLIGYNFYDQNIEVNLSYNTNCKRNCKNKCQTVFFKICTCKTGDCSGCIKNLLKDVAVTVNLIHHIKCIFYKRECVDKK